MSIYGFLHGGKLFRSKPSEDDDDEELDESSGADDYLDSRPWGPNNDGYEEEE